MCMIKCDMNKQAGFLRIQTDWNQHLQARNSCLTWWSESKSAGWWQAAMKKPGEIRELHLLQSQDVIWRLLFHIFLTWQSFPPCAHTVLLKNPRPWWATSISQNPPSNTPRRRKDTFTSELRQQFMMLLCSHDGWEVIFHNPRRLSFLCFQGRGTTGLMSADVCRWFKLQAETIRVYDGR